MKAQCHQHASSQRPRTAKIHQWFGVLLLVPLLVWTITGSIFLTKPGYEQAYEKLKVRTYVGEWLPMAAMDAGWQEVRRVRTVLGEHLLVKVNGEWQQLDVESRQPRDPSLKDVQRLMEDAFLANPQRYGVIDSLDGLQAITSTNVKVTLNWQQLSFIQRGDDTRRIQSLYRLHYLQWTGHPSLDLWLGVGGLVSLLSLSLLGFLLVLKGGRSTSEKV